MKYLKNHTRRKHSNEAAEDGEPEIKRSRLSAPIDEGEFNKFVKKKMKEDSPFDPMDLLKMQMGDEEEQTKS